VRVVRESRQTVRRLHGLNTEISWSALTGRSIVTEQPLKRLKLQKRCGSKLLAVSAADSEAELEEAKAYVNKVVEMAQEEGIQVEALPPIGRAHDVIVEIAGG
jgi:hypothetical protein